VEKGESHFSEMRSFARSLMLIKPLAITAEEQLHQRKRLQQIGPLP